MAYLCQGSANPTETIFQWTCSLAWAWDCFDGKFLQAQFKPEMFAWRSSCCCLRSKAVARMYNNNIKLQWWHNSAAYFFFFSSSSALSFAIMSFNDPKRIRHKCQSAQLLWMSREINTTRGDLCHRVPLQGHGRNKIINICLPITNFWGSEIRVWMATFRFPSSIRLDLFSIDRWLIFLWKNTKKKKNGSFLLYLVFVVNNESGKVKLKAI